MRFLLIAVIALAACKSKPAPPPAEQPRQASPEPIKRLSPQEVKAKVEAAQQQHEEQIDKRFDEAQKQGQ